MLFLNRLADHTRTNPDRPALTLLDESHETTLSYAELEGLVCRAIGYLQRQGIAPGDRVALQLPKGLPFIALHLAALRLGAISLPLNPTYPPDELAYFLGDSAARLLAIDAATPPEPAMLAGLPELRTIAAIPADSDPVGFFGAPPTQLPALPTDPDQTALMIYTSGTTGKPKGAETTHANLSANLDALHTAWGWRSDDILLHVLPIFHVHGLVVALHGALHAAAHTIMPLRFSPAQALETMVARRCTVFMAVPTIHRRLLDLPADQHYDLRHMRLLTSGSDRLPDDLFTAFRERFGHSLLERYGMTETGMNLSNPLEGERRIGSVGLPLPGVEARIVDPESGALLGDNLVGELQIRGPHVFKGYWRRPEQTAEAFTSDGWLHTGDLALREPDGYYTLKGRAKDLIITGGLNVYPPEVELVLADLAGIVASAVIGCPDDEWGEQVTAVVVREPGSTLDAAAIIAHCRAHLAPYKAPRRVVFVETLPQNALGKVQKAQLRAQLCGT